MGTLKTCWGCGEPIQTGHYHDTVPAGSVLSSTCRELNTAKRDRQRQAVKRAQSAALNHGTEVGKNSKELSARIEKFTVRSRSEVAKMIGCSVEGVRIAEIRALEKVRKYLMPFHGAVSGEAKIKQVTQPIPSLSD